MRIKEEHVFLDTEKSMALEGFLQIAGLDEAGCGPLAGPVVAGAVILPRQFWLKPDFLTGLNDSKKLSAKKRDILYDEIINTCLWGIGLSTPQEIDVLNIRQATFLAMKRAIEALQIKPDLLLVDAWHLPFWAGEQRAIVQGDAKVKSIAAASVLAKVKRDCLMAELEEIYPEYGFNRHKGYPTKAHYEALFIYGPCVAHRKSFLKTIDKHKKNGV